METVFDCRACGMKGEKYRLAGMTAIRARCSDEHCICRHVHLNLAAWNAFSKPSDCANPQPDLTGPVRTVTRKEIVPGVYGHVHVGEEKEISVVWMPLDAAELRAAIATLTQIADALEDQA